MNIDIGDLVKEIFLEHRVAKSFVVLGFIIAIFFPLIDTSENYSYVLVSGLMLFSIGIIFLVLSILWHVAKIGYYRYRYPLKSLTKDYYLVRFGGPVFLFDISKKEKRLIGSWQTALDLGYLYHWVEVLNEKNVINAEQILINDSVTIKNNEYVFRSMIRTRGIPGS